MKVYFRSYFYKLDLTFFEDDIYWLIDPIDGSANLSRKLSHSYISVCLISKEGFPLISVIVTIVLLKVELMCTTPVVIFNFARLAEDDFIFANMNLYF